MKKNTPSTAKSNTSSTGPGRTSSTSKSRFPLARGGSASKPSSTSKVSRGRTPNRTPTNATCSRNLNLTQLSSTSKSLGKSPMGSTERINLSHIPNSSRVASRSNILVGLSSNSNSNSTFEFDAIVAYTKYLQALLKLQIVEETGEQQKTIFEEQILYQTHRLEEKKVQKQEIINKTMALEKRGHYLNVVGKWQAILTRANAFYNEINLSSSLEKVKLNLDEKADSVVLINIKPIDSMEEYEVLRGVIKSCNSIAGKLLTGQHIEKVNVLALELETCDNLKKDIKAIRVNMLDLKKQIIVELTQKISDFFAKAGGYD